MDEAALPPGLTRRIRSISHRTRLRRSERAIVAQILCEEATDRLAAGESPRVLLASLRPKARIARQFRRDLLKAAPARKAGWAIASWVKRSIATSLLATLLVYPYLFWRFHAPDPRLTRNLGAEFNVIVDAISPEDRATDLYSRADALFEEIPDKSARTFGIAWPFILPEDRFWPEACAYIDRNEAAIAMIREGAARPHLGYRLSTAPPTDPASAELDPSGAWGGNPFWMGLCLEPFGQYRNFSRILAADARLAAERDEPDRAVHDIVSMFGMAGHAEEGRSVIGDLVGSAIRSLAFELIGELVTAEPALLDADHLDQLTFAVGAALRPDGPKVDLEIERLAQFDLAQRVFTDDGKGDGRICFSGIRFLRAVAGEPEWDLGSFVLGPLNAFRFTQRRQYLDEVEAMCSAIARESEAPLWLWTEMPGTDFVRQREAMSGRAVLLDAPVTLAPSLGKAAFVYEQSHQVRDAALVMIALARHHLDLARYPDSLHALVPRYLPEIPPDRYDGGPIKYIISEGGSPVLYSVGSDRVDDGGIPQEGDASGTEAMNWYPPDQADFLPPGDWIILPRPPPEPDQPDDE